MKNLITFVLLIFLAGTVSSQTAGTISYTESMKIDIDFGDSSGNIPDSMKDLIPTTMDRSTELLFNKSESLYREQDGSVSEDVEMESDDGSFKMVIMTDDTEDILYVNSKEKKMVHQRGLMSKSFLVSKELPKTKWKITTEKVKYLDYECQKAELEEDGKLTVAWFTPQIPSSIGPSGYYGLPGAILMLTADDGDREIKATKVTFDDNVVAEIAPPSEGKKVTEEEYEKIQKEREEEMTQMHTRRETRRRN